jgi:hypothetical protein
MKEVRRRLRSWPSLIYQGIRHVLTESYAPVPGPPWHTIVAGWLLDRVNRVSAHDEFRYVTASEVLIRPEESATIKHLTSFCELSLSYMELLETSLKRSNSLHHLLLCFTPVPRMSILESRIRSLSST